MSRRLDKQTKAQERAAKKFGFATVNGLRRGPLQYRWDIIEDDVNKLLSRRHDIPVDGKVPGAFPKDFVNYMAGIYLSCCHAERVPLPEALLHLVCQQLGVSSFGMQGPTQKSDVLAVAVSIREREPSISQKALARRLGVSPRTIRRWECEGSLPFERTLRGGQS